MAEKQEWHTTNLHANYPHRFHKVMVVDTLQCEIREQGLLPTWRLFSTFLNGVVLGKFVISMRELGDINHDASIGSHESDRNFCCQVGKDAGLSSLVRRTSIRAGVLGNILGRS